MSHPDEGLIHEWLDGELSADEAARVERLVASDATWAAAAAEARGLIAASSRIVRALDAVPAHVVPKGTRAGGSRASRFRVRPWMAAAASIVVAAGVGYAVWPTAEQVVLPAPSVSVVEQDAGPAVTASTGAGATSAPQEVARSAAQPPREDRRVAAAAEPSAPPPVVADRTTETQAAEDQAKSAATLSARTRSATLDAAERTAGMRQEAARGAGAPAPAAAMSPMLDGCWRVSQPDSLAAFYSSTIQVTEQRGDTLTLTVPHAPQPAKVRVVREQDALRGGLTAQRVTTCPE